MIEQGKFDPEYLGSLTEIIRYTGIPRNSTGMGTWSGSKRVDMFSLGQGSMDRFVSGAING